MYFQDKHGPTHRPEILPYFRDYARFPKTGEVTVNKQSTHTASDFMALVHMINRLNARY